MTASGKRPDGEADDRERRQRPAAHGVDVADGVGRRDLAEQIRVVHGRREHVHRLHERQVAVEQEHARVVAGRRADQHARVVERRAGRPGRA